MLGHGGEEPLSRHHTQGTSPTSNVDLTQPWISYVSPLASLPTLTLHII